MDFLQVLMVFIIIATVIKVAVDNVNAIVLPFFDIKKYSLLTAFVLTSMAVITYNNGILTALQVPTEFSFQPYFHIVDIFISILVLTGGANAVHQIVNGINEYKLNKGVEKK